jgi:late competence protein required for DNA uptake (superfamily II DNA/RNA helicase)
MRMRHIFPCGLAGSTTLLHIISQKARFSKEKEVIKHKMCVLMYSTTSVIIRRIQRDVMKKYLDFHLKYPLLLLIFTSNLNFLEIFEKILKYYFHENPSSGSRIVPCGRADGQTDNRQDEASSCF